MIQEWDVADLAPSSIDRGTRLDATRLVESGGNPNAVSPAGAVGPYQFMPATARQYGVTNPRDENQARAGADRYLAQLEQRYGGNAELAHLAYNWGEGNVDSWLKTGKGVKGQPMPKEAQEYVGKIMSAVDKQPRAQKPQPLQEWSDADVAPKAALPKATGKSATTQAAESVLAEMPWYEKALVGAGKSVADVGRTLGLLPKGDEEIDKALLETTPGMVGNLAGDIAVTAVPGGGATVAGTKLATKVLPKVLKKGLQGKIISGAAGGAAGGAVAEGMLGRDVEEGAGVGAAVGGAIPVAGRVLNEAIKQVQRSRAGPRGAATDYMRSLAGPNLQQTIDDLRNTRPFVPGEQPTAGMAAQPHSAYLAALEARARRNPESVGLFRSADEATVAARERALDDIAAGGRGTVDPITGQVGESVHESLRSGATRPLYDQAMRERLPVTEDLWNVITGPNVNPFFRRMMNSFQQESRNAQNAGRRLPQGGRWVPHGGGERMDRMSGQQLQMLQRELDSEIARAGQNAPFELIEARRAIADTLNQSPTFRTANELFREMSAPQNRAQVAEALVSKLRNPADNINQRILSFENTLNNPGALFKRADLSPRFRNMEQVFAPTQMEAAAVRAPNATEGMTQLESIRNVERSLQRQARTEGFDKNASIIPEYKSIFDKARDMMPDVMNRLMTIAKSSLKKFGNRSDADVERIINRAMVNPNEMAKIMAAVPPTERNAMINMLRQMNLDPVTQRMITPATVTINQE